MLIFMNKHKFNSVYVKLLAIFLILAFIMFLFFIFLTQSTISNTLDTIFSLEKTARYSISDLKPLISEAKQDIEWRMMIFCLITLTLSFLIGIWFIKRIIKPLHHLVIDARKIALGNYDQTSKIDTHDELQQVSESLHTISTKLRDMTISRDYMDSILNYMANLLIVTDDEGIILTINRSALELLGYLEYELVGKSINHVFAEPQFREPAPKIIEHINQIIKDGYILNNEQIYYTKSGLQIPVLFSGSVIRDKDQKLQRIVCIAQDITKQKLAENKLTELAHYDSLTQLPNRLDFDKRLKSVLSNAHRHKRLFSVLLIDLDNFKKINDNFGHAAGDRLLK